MNLRVYKRAKKNTYGIRGENQILTSFLFHLQALLWMVISRTKTLTWPRQP